MISVKEYWEGHNVTNHCGFKDDKASLQYFHWRNSQYFSYIELMPVSGQDNKVILDYGCGPGNDLVGFGVYSKPARIIAADISMTSLNEAKARVNLHHIPVEFFHIEEKSNIIPLDTSSVDYIHCSGVLHHLNEESLYNALEEFKRILKPGGTGRIMVYNYDSLWVHLYVAYQKMIVEGLYSNLAIREAFAKTTDGANCPISNVYTPLEFNNLVKAVGIDCQFLGAAISMHELSLHLKKFDAIMSQLLRKESRDFLLDLTLDEHGFPMFKGVYAGIDGCYLIKK